MSEFMKGIGREIILGDFHNGDATVEGTVGNVVIGLIPFVGQVADFRDTVAAIKDVKRDYKNIGTWIGLGITALCWIPGTDSIKGFKKTIKANISNVVKSKDSITRGVNLAIGNGNWRAFFSQSNVINLLNKGYSKKSRTQYGISKLFYNDKPYKNVSSQYRKTGSKSAKKIRDIQHIELQHLWWMNSNKHIPQGIKNSGLNLLEIPDEFNTWMSNKKTRNWTFRAIVLSILAASAWAGWDVGSYLTESASLKKSNMYSKSLILE